MYFQLYAGNNKVSDLGCNHLSQAKWSSLKKLNLSQYSYKLDHNQVTSEGLHSLSTGKWPIL